MGQGDHIVSAELPHKGLTGEGVEAVMPAGNAEPVLSRKMTEAGELIPVPDKQQHKQDWLQRFPPGPWSPHHTTTHPNPVNLPFLSVILDISPCVIPDIFNRESSVFVFCLFFPLSSPTRSWI